MVCIMYIVYITIHTVLESQRVTQALARARVVVPICCGTLKEVMKWKKSVSPCFIMRGKI